MARNPIANNYATLMVQANDAYQGALALGSSIPLLVNTAPIIDTDLVAAQSAQIDYKKAKGGLDPLYTALHALQETVYTFCFTARDLLRVYCGRDYSQCWMAAGFDQSLQVPRSYAGQAALLVALNSYFSEYPDHENEAIGITAAQAATRHTALQAAHNAVVMQKGLITAAVQERDVKVTALRKRLSGLCKELSQRFGPLDPRWRDFGFNMPGEVTVPPVPQNVVALPDQPGRLLVTCDPSPTATHYRFFYQRPIVDPEPNFAGHAADPMFAITGLTPGQSYLVYVMAVNDGAESLLSKPVSAVVSLSAAA